MGLPFFVFLKVGGPRVFSVKKLPGVFSVKKLTLLLYTPLNYIGVHEKGGGWLDSFPDPSWEGGRA